MPGDRGRKRNKMKQESRNLAVTLTAGMIAILLIVCAAVSFVGCRQLARSLDRAKTEALSADGSGAAGEAAGEESASEKTADGETAGKPVSDSAVSDAAYEAFEKTEKQNYLRAVGAVTAGCCLIAFAVVFIVLTRMVIKPVRELTGEALRYAGDDSTAQGSTLLAMENPYEIGGLARSIRKMEVDIDRYIGNLRHVTAEKERISTELNVATQIQAEMLPRIFPPFPDRREFDIYATMTPAKGVSGDFYDFCLMDKDHLAMVIADVSGKGVPAALFMVIARTLLKNRIQEGGSPSEILSDVNEKLCEGNESHLFVTVWMAVLELSTGKGVAANAGHEHPALMRNGGSFEIIKYRHSPALAIMEGMHFREHNFQLYPGDCLFVYTDGVPEASNEKQEMFGEERLLNALNRDKFESAKDLLRSVRNQIDDFEGEAMQFDDLTMLAFYYAGPSEGTDSCEDGTGPEDFSSGAQDYGGSPGNPDSAGARSAVSGNTEAVDAGGDPEAPAGEVADMGETKINEFQIAAEIANLDEVLNFVDEQLESMECTPKARMQLDMAVEEMFVNIASYAYGGESGPAWIRMWFREEGKMAVVELIDRGVPYDPLAKEDPDVTLSLEKRAVGGLGIFMVKKSVDRMRYNYEDGCNIVTLEKRIAP